MSTETLERLSERYCASTADYMATLDSQYQTDEETRARFEADEEADRQAAEENFDTMQTIRELAS